MVMFAKGAAEAQVAEVVLVQGAAIAQVGARSCKSCISVW